MALSRPLDLVLTKIAGFAAEAVPGADGAGLALIRADRPDTVVASEHFVREMDNAQYRLDEGPCLAACASRETQLSGVLSADPRWPRFGSEAARLGVSSALCLPLLLAGHLLGSLNVYARARDAFTSNAVRIGALFAEPAAVSVASAHLLVENQVRVESLTSGLTDQLLIHQAIGIVMCRTDANATDSLETLRAMGREQDTDLVTLANQLRGNPHLPMAASHRA